MEISRIINEIPVRSSDYCFELDEYEAVQQLKFQLSSLFIWLSGWDGCMGCLNANSKPDLQVRANAGWYSLRNNAVILKIWDREQSLTDSICLRFINNG